MGVGYNPSILTTGMVTYWDVGNTKSYPGSGSTISNLYASNTASIVGAVAYQNRYLYNFSDSNYLTMSNVPTPGSSDFTYSFWVYLTSLASSSTLLHIYNPSTTLIIRANFSTSVYVNFASTEFGLSFSNSLSTNTWYNIVVTRSGTTVSGYLNGAASTSTGTSSQLVTGSTLELGRLTLASGQYLFGYIASFSAYNCTLTASEVRQNFNALRGRFGV